MVPRLRLTLAAVAFYLLAAMATGPGATPRFTEWTVPVNLGSPINSAATDAGPCLSRNGLSLYFNSTRAGGLGDNDIWVSRRPSVDAPWGIPQNLGATVNTGAMEGVPVLSRDEHWLYFNSNRGGGSGSIDLWASYRSDTHDDLAWEVPVNLGAYVNGPAFDVGASPFENDEGGAPMLFFSSSRPGGLGSFDIYVTDGGGDQFPGPVYSVLELNSTGSDQKPSVRFDGLELFFQSDRTPSRGADLWVSVRDTPWSVWSEPANLGATVNSADIDQQPFIAADRETLLFASTRPGGAGGLDIWMTMRAKMPAR